MEASAVGPPAVLFSGIVIAFIVNTVNIYYKFVPEKSRIFVGYRFMYFCLYVPPLLYGVSGYLFWITGSDLVGIYISYFVITSIACVIRSLVPLIEYRKGYYAGKWVCLLAYILSYGSLCSTLHWAIMDEPTCLIAHSLAILILSVYDLPLYIIRAFLSAESLPLLDPDGISPVQN